MAAGAPRLPSSCALRCSEVDPRAATYFADQLLRYAALALVNANIDPATADAKAVSAILQTFQQTLMGSNGIAERSAPSGASAEAAFGAQLSAAMEDAAQATKSGWASLDVLGVFKDEKKREAKMLAFSRVLSSGGLFDESARCDVAHVLVALHDVTCAAHCGMEFATDAALAIHREMECAFRSLSCSFDGCDVIVASRHALDHAGTCPRRPTRCALNGGCGTTIAFADVAAHDRGCPKRAVQCPFHASLGCDGLSAAGAALLADGVAAHCDGVDQINSHLHTASRVIAQQRARIDASGALVAAQGRALEALRQELAQCRADGDVTRSQLLALQKGVEERHEVQTRSVGAVVKKVATLTSRLGKTEAAATKMARVVVANQKTVQALATASSR